MVTGCEAVCYWRTGLCVYNFRFYTILVDKVRNPYAANVVQRIYFVKPQGFDHRVDRVLSLFFSRWNWDPPPPLPHPQASVPPLVPCRGGAHSLAGRGGGSQFNSNEGHTLWYSRYICTVRLRWPAKVGGTLWDGGGRRAVFSRSAECQCCGSVTFWYGSGSADPNL